MAKRVFEIAKELGVESKAIVAKCHEEGVPDSVIKGHMSTVTAGLEASIRDWFSASAESGTAVETADKVDLAKVQRPRKARPIRQADSAPPQDDGPAQDQAVAVAEVEPAVAPQARAIKPAEPPAVVEQPPETTTEHVAIEEAPAPVAEAGAVEAPAAPTAPTRVSPAAKHEPKPGPSADEDQPGGGEPVRPSGGAGSRRPQPVRMNVPKRPQVISPAGPQLADRAPVKLSGPKIVRVEAPEVMEAPRARRSSPSSSGAPSGGGGRGVGTGARSGSGEDDRGPRRTQNKRRAGEGGGIPARRRGLAVDVEVPQGAWSEQDLAEREARLQRAGGFMKQRRQQQKRQQQAGGERLPGMGGRSSGRITVTSPFTIKDLSAATGVKAAEIVKKLFLQGIMATINSGIDADRAQEIMMEYDIDLDVVEAKSAEAELEAQFGGERTGGEVRRRGPVVTILGHVDHGKTSLLDKIRNANVAAGEAGGITQATSAFRVSVQVAGEEKEIVFLDTPGHEAFTAMRARGANMTDVVVLVVSAPEGVMPQTIESINHAKAAKVPIVVALNKIDRPDATDAAIQKTLSQLADAGLNPVEWGGDTEIVRTSATTGQGVNDLLEVLDYQAQLLDLTADFSGSARGTVIEAKSEPGRGAVASVLVREGQLQVGDFIVAGRAFGRVRDITDDRGQKLKTATPPMPVVISGIDEIPDAGDKFYSVDTLRQAQEAAEQRREREREAALAQPKVTLDSLFNRMAESGLKEILVVLKADVQGSVDVIRHEIEKVSGDEVKTRVLHSAVGGVTESDVLLADASKAIIVGFNVIPSGKARRLAEQKGVEIRTYRVIYDIVDDMRAAAEGLLAPELREEVLGHAEVRKVFKITRVGAIAGCYVTDGTVQRDALVRVTRGGIVIEHDRRLEQLKRFKDDVKDVRMGMECGMKIVGYDDIKDGDIIECYKKIEVKRTL
ncbi:MAG: translation initiation factor IF-2 [Phycisphaeraceae bacterium]|nr:translation initiation factor IF-2 [Phycisphaeraceae bacterium]